MGIRLTSDTTGEELLPDEAVVFSINLRLEVSPIGKALIDVSTPKVVIRKTSEDIRDNVEFQAFHADVVDLQRDIQAAWTTFKQRVQSRLR